MSKQMNGWIAALRSRAVNFGAWGWLAMVTVLAVAAAGFLYAATATGTPSSDGSDQFSRPERDAINALVRQYILDHPEIIPEAINRLQEREVAKLLDSNRAEIQTPFAGAWTGNPDGDVVLVEFFDYACPYCRASKADVDRLIAEDKNLKVVYRDFPVLGPASEEAALASLSAARQGRYKPFHNAMFSSGRPSHEKIIAAVRQAGLNEVETAKALSGDTYRSEIAKNLDLGRALGLTGTPAYVIGNRILSGAVGYDEMKRAIAEARANRS
jgi:protein-disulfide isomerase